MSAENQSQVLCKCHKCSESLSHFSNPTNYVLKLYFSKNKKTKQAKSFLEEKETERRLSLFFSCYNQDHYFAVKSKTENEKGSIYYIDRSKPICSKAELQIPYKPCNIHR